MMTTERIECTLCNHPGKWDQSPDVARVHSNIRKFRDKAFTVWRCTGCNSIHSKEAVDLHYYYQYYPTIVRENSSSSQEVVIQPFEKPIYANRARPILKHGYGKTSRILDYGCNRGAFIQYLIENGYTDVTGYDPYHEGFQDDSVLKRKFDVITLQDVIEHIEDPIRLMETLYRMLEDQGILIIGTPNADEIDLREANGRANFELHQPYHRQIFSEGALIDLGKRLGLRALSVNKRWSVDTRVPFVNGAFLANYVLIKGNVADSILTEPVDLKSVMLSPKLIMYGLFGYYFRRRGNMEIVFAK